MDGERQRSSGGLVRGTAVAILATLTDTLDLLYQLANEPVGMVVGFITGSIATSLAFLAGGYTEAR